jgi:hypothetical protein
MSFQTDAVVDGTAREKGHPPLTKLELFVERAVFEQLKEELAEWATTQAWSEVNLRIDEGRGGVYRGLEYAADAAPMMKLEAYVPTRALGRIVDEIERIVPTARLRRLVFAVVRV